MTSNAVLRGSNLPPRGQYLNERRKNIALGMQRSFREGKNKRAKLTLDQVDEIKELCGYMSNKELAQAFKISPAEVCAIRYEQRWWWI